MSPSVFDAYWPRKFTPLTSQATGPWMVALGIFAIQAVVENDHSRTRAGLVSYFAFGLLELIVLLRYPDSIAWERTVSWLYVGFIVSFIIVGARTAFGSRQQHLNPPNPNG